MKALNVHIPRTAGTSLWANLCTAFQGRYLSDYDHDPLGGTYLPRPYPKGVELVLGHMRPDLYTGADFISTFLRDPVDIVIGLHAAYTSGLDSGLWSFHMLRSRFQEFRPPLIDFANWPEIRYLLSRTFFGGFDMNRFDFIGLFDNRENDLARLSAKIGYPLSSELHHNQRLQPALITPIERESVTELLEEDIDFYQTWSSRCLKS